MLAINYSNFRESLKSYCDRVSDEVETLVVTRKSGGNVVVLSEGQYNNLMENLYLRSNPTNYARLAASIEQLARGGYSAHELIDTEDGEESDTHEESIL